MSKKWWIALGVIVVLLGIVVAVPLLVNVNAYRDVIESRLGKALNRQVVLHDLRLSLMPVALETKDVLISDDPSFRSGDFVRIERFRLHLDLWPLLRRQIQVTSLEMIGPTVWLVRNSQGEWNFSSMAESEAKAPNPTAASNATAAAPLRIRSLDISNLAIKNGRIVILDQTHPNDPKSYDVLELTARNISARSAFSFSLTLSSIMEKEPVHFQGQVGPLDLNNLANSPARGTIEAKSLHAAKVRFENLKGQFTVSQGTLKFNPLDFDIYSGHESGTMTVNSLQARPSLELTSHLSRIDANQLLSSNSSSKNLFYGLLSGDLSLEIRGENQAQVLRELTGRAALELQNGKLSHVSIGHQIALVAKLVGVSFPEGETPINKMAGHFDIGDNWARTNDLQIEIPDLSLLCQGGFNFDSELNFNVLATFSQGASQKIRAENPLGGLLSGLLENQNKQATVPVQVTGAFQAPHFRLDTQRLLSLRKGQPNSPSKIGDTIQSLQDLFKKKKK